MVIHTVAVDTAIVTVVMGTVTQTVSTLITVMEMQMIPLKENLRQSRIKGSIVRKGRYQTLSSSILRRGTNNL